MTSSENDRITDPDAEDGGPGAHTEDATGGATNDPASGGVPESADDEEREPPA